MRTKYSWCFPLTEDEIKSLWDEAILTVDANVLLDLYRYHEDTRNALLDALKGFAGRVWLSHQTAEEFFRNRKKVIVSSVNSFDDARQKLEDIKASAIDPINRIKGNRIIPDAIAERFREALDLAIASANEEIDRAKTSHPDFLDEDPILEAVSELFEGHVGEAFDEKELEEAIREGKRRMDNKIPPGYMDAKKDGARPYGDFFMWRQILNYAESEKKAIIFVTSEGKDDWWEKSSGRTTGLHYELQKEVYEASGNRLLAYRTDRFFSFYEEIKGQSNESAAAEISALVKARAAANPLVQAISQLEATSTSEWNEGALSVELYRPAYAFTCSGHFKPNLQSVPSVRARLIEHPDGLPQHIVRSGTGTTFDFNIHLKSTVNEEYLPAGEYVFEYVADAQSDTSEADAGHEI